MTDVASSFEPFGDRVLVRPLELEGNEQTASGLYIPETAREESQVGEVLVVGPGALNEHAADGGRHPVSCEVGDFVLYGKFAGTEITLGGESLLVLREADLYGRVEATREDIVTGQVEYARETQH